MERFIIANDVTHVLPGMLVVVVTANNLNNREPRPAVDAYSTASANAALSTLDALPNVQSHPRVAHYRATLKAAAGIPAKKFPQSNESLLKRLTKIREPGRINPLVDFYNAVSIRHAVTAGAFDVKDLGELGTGTDLELRFSRTGDLFRALDAGEDADESAVPAGELSYCVGRVVLTRQLAWRQALQGLVTAKTSQVMLMSEILSDEAAEVAELVRKDLVDGLKTFFGVDAESHILGHGTGKLDMHL